MGSDLKAVRKGAPGEAPLRPVILSTAKDLLLPGLGGRDTPVAPPNYVASAENVAQIARIADTVGSNSYDIRRRGAPAVRPGGTGRCQHHFIGALGTSHLTCLPALEDKLTAESFESSLERTEKIRLHHHETLRSETCWRGCPRVLPERIGYLLSLRSDPASWSMIHVVLQTGTQRIDVCERFRHLPGKSSAHPLVE